MLKKQDKKVLFSSIEFRDFYKESGILLSTCSVGYNSYNVFSVEDGITRAVIAGKIVITDSSSEAVKRNKAIIDEALKKNRSLVSGRYTDRDGTVIGMNEPCHYWIQRLKNPTEYIDYICHHKARLEDVWDKKYKGTEWTGADLHKDFISWLIKDSGFARCFKTKQYHIAMRYGIKVNMDAGINEVAGALIASRFVSEFCKDVNSRRAISYIKARQRGLDQAQAYFMSAMFYSDEHGWYYTFPSGGHCILTGEVKLEGYVRVLLYGFASEKAGIPLSQCNLKPYRVNDNISASVKKGVSVTEIIDRDKEFKATLKEKVGREGWNAAIVRSDEESVFALQARLWNKALKSVQKEMQ